jgi:hypothetical protein
MERAAVSRCSFCGFALSSGFLLCFVFPDLPFQLHHIVRIQIRRAVFQFSLLLSVIMVFPYDRVLGRHIRALSLKSSKLAVNSA